MFQLDRELLSPVIEQVKKILLKQKFLSPDVVESETEHFFGPLGLVAACFAFAVSAAFAASSVSAASAASVLFVAANIPN